MSNNKFVVNFKGVRGSYPISNKNFLKYGGNTSCIYVNVGNHIIILDAGSGIVNTGKQILEEKIMSQNYDSDNITILLSHLHLDHIQGLPFFPQLHTNKVNINLFAPAKNEAELTEQLNSIIFNTGFPLSTNEIESNFSINAINPKNKDFAILLKENNPTPIITKTSIIKQEGYNEKDVLITVMHSKTHPKNGVLIYKIEYNKRSLVYATDKEGYSNGDKALSIFARGTDLLIHDAQYTNYDYNSISNIKQGFGHSSFDMAITEKNISHAKALAFFHYDPTYDDNKIDEIKKSIINKTDGLIMPFEDMEYIIL